eukprot:m.59916 g.59916  ORF g.59916 m.59916 type:complete len:129 (-) comp22778_c0_seq1:6149-6535(-)
MTGDARHTRHTPTYPGHTSLYSHAFYILNCRPIHRSSATLGVGSNDDKWPKSYKFQSQKILKLKRKHISELLCERNFQGFKRFKRCLSGFRINIITNTSLLRIFDDSDGVRHFAQCVEERMIAQTILL